jgi:hypothetical protein
MGAVFGSKGFGANVDLLAHSSTGSPALADQPQD